LDVPAACVAAVELHRIHSSPTRRMHARLKFLVEDWGAEKFLAVWRDFFQAARATVGRPVAAEKLQPTAPMASNREFFQAWLLAVPNGDLPAAAAFDLADLARKFQAKIRLNCDQNLVFVLADAHTSSFQAAAKKLGFVPFDCAPKKNVIACMGAPLCRRALADAKHAANLLAACLRAENLVLPDDAVIAISGCPNNCAGHSIAEFGFSGFKRTVNGIQSERYVAFLGGSRNDGGRLGHRTEKRLPPKELGPFIKEILERDGKPR
jgi:sulfite reductase beta subunit-like hemoprotein